MIEDFNHSLTIDGRLRQWSVRQDVKHLNMNTKDMSVIDLKAFVPTKDSAISRQFYTDLGFKQNWANDQIAEFQIGSFRFLLQPFYVQ